MNKFVLSGTWLALLVVVFAFAGAAHAQDAGSLLRSVAGSLTQRMQQNIEQRPAQNVDNRVDSTNDRSGDRRRSLIIHGQSDFVPGDVTLFQDDLASAPLGSMPSTWKTNGSGEVVSLQGIPGKWLQLQEFASYKLASPIDFPSRFTVEFDVVVAADQVRDAGNFVFGFARDNSVRNYIPDAYNEGALNGVSVPYMNGSSADVSVSSSATGYHHASPTDLTGYADRVMHVAFAVDGDTAQVYLDKTKVADTRLFDHNPVKHLFLSAPIRYDHGARILASNFRIAGFK